MSTTLWIYSDNEGKTMFVCGKCKHICIYLVKDWLVFSTCHLCIYGSKNMTWGCELCLHRRDYCESTNGK